MNNNSYLLEKVLLAKQESILAKEEVFWRQKSREKWLDEGDRYTKFFHNSTLFNRAMNYIIKVKDTLGAFTDNPKLIVETFVSHFRNILNNFDSSNLVPQTKVLEAIPQMITIEDNKILNKPITMEEAKLALFSMNPDKSAVLDRFQAFFY